MTSIWQFYEIATKMLSNIKAIDYLCNKILKLLISLRKFIMKRLFLFSLLLMTGVCLSFSQNRAEQIRKALLERDTTKVFVASHRGDWRNYPENSIEGINSAIDMGADIIEIDLQRTKDGVLLLMHDAKLDRTTTGKGKVAERTWDEISKLNLRAGHHIRTAQKVPTLEEVLLATKGRAMLNLDKADRYFDQVYELCKKTGTERQIIMKGKLPAKEVKQKYGAYLDEILYMPIVQLDSVAAMKNIDEFIEVLNPTAFELLYVKDTNERPGQLRQSLNGKALRWYNTLWDTMAGGHDDDATLKDVNNGWGYLIDKLGANIIQTDRPAMMIEYLRGRGLHD